MAAELIEAGVDVHDIYRRLYERVPIEKLHLVARAIERIERFDDCRLAVTYISADDYAETGASDILTEGIIDHVRALEGTEVAAMIRDKTDGGRAARKVSLRSTDGRVDVSAIARKHGGGGHPRAAGFSTDLPTPSWSSSSAPRSGRSSSSPSVARHDRRARPPGVLLVDKPAGMTSHDVVAAASAASAVKGRPCRHARPVRHRAADRAPRAQAPDPALFLPLPKTYRATARLGWHSTTGDPDGELTETGAVPERLELPTGRIRQRVPMTSAVKVEGERLYRSAPPWREHRDARARGRGLPRRAPATRGDSAEFEIQCSTGTYVRTLIETLGDAYCELLRRTAVGPFRVEDANGEPLAERARVPARAGPGRGRGGARRARGPVARRGRRAAEAHPEGRAGRRPAPDARFGPKSCSHTGRACVKGFAPDSMSIKVTQLPDAEPRPATSRSASSTASTSATAR